MRPGVKRLRGEAMTFDEVLDQVREQLQREGRVSYRALKRRFAIDDDYIEDLKAELIDAKQLAVDEDGKVLVWTEAESRTETEKRGNGETGKRGQNKQLLLLTLRLTD
jgi:hypothetical protein